jgi:hypothetical protein
LTPDEGAKRPIRLVQPVLQDLGMDCTLLGLCLLDRWELRRLQPKVTETRHFSHAAFPSSRPAL